MSTYCNGCGAVIPDGMVFCTYCGKDQKLPSPIKQKKSMFWGNVVAFVLIPIHLILSFTSAVNFLAGAIYADNLEVSNVYSTYPELQIADVMVAILAFASFGFAIYSIVNFARKRGSVITTIVVTYALAIAANVVFFVTAGMFPLQLYSASITNCTFSIVVCLIMLLINHSYFQKRAQIYLKF